jgi:hypothetical protein
MKDETKITSWCLARPGIVCMWDSVMSLCVERAKWDHHQEGIRFPSMDDSSYRRNFDSDKKNEVIAIAGKSILKWVKLQSLVANCCKMRKI